MPEYPNPKLREAPPPTSVSFTPAAEAYVELDVKSNFTFLCGASHPDELVYRAAELGYRAIAVTDVNSLAGAVRMHDAAREVGLKLLIGTRLTFTDAPDLLTWATNRASYARLCRLLTLGKRRTEKGKCLLAIDDFLKDNQGLLAAVDEVETARHAGDSNTLSDREVLADLREALGDRLSMAASCLYGGDDSSRLQRLQDRARRFDIPLVATNNVHYHDPARRRLQDVLTCVRHGCTIGEAGLRLFANGERYLKSPRQMHQLFAEMPKALQRGLEIADRCDFSLKCLKYEYPDEVIASGQKPIEYLSDLAWAGAAERYRDGIPGRVRSLIARELELIEQLKFEAYFLTVYDLVRFARSRGMLCQGRGSAANSAVCYCLGVTSVDPGRINLLFERFISAARNEPPDIDIDFEHERREEVLQYIYEKYGRERAGMTAEVITYRGRSAVRDVGKAMGLSLDMVDTMASKLDWWHKGVLTREQILECGLDPRDRTVRQVISLATELLGFPRHLSQHVGGMIMTRGPLCEMVPIENASMDDRTVIEWDKDDIDSLGILKVDVLALGMLTCISKAFQMIKSRGETDDLEQSCAKLASTCIELYNIPPEDPAVYDMICDADTVGVFQIESRAQMTMLPRLRPRCFYDLVIEVAIVRPGPIQGNMVHPYLRRRNGEEPVSYPSEAMRDVLAKTLGVPLFQEQAMRLAMVGAGFSGAEADQLRRVMAAWRRSGAIESFQRKIVQGMVRNGYALEFAEQCFNQIKGFGEYGFPESHAASFALLVYVSAWLKRHHPAAFAAGLLNSQPMGFYMPAQIVCDAREHGVEVRPVDVNASNWDCTLEWTPQTAGRSDCKSHWGSGGPALRLGMRQIKGFREVHANQIAAERVRNGPFSDVEQVQIRASVPAASMKQLAEADAFGSLSLSRRPAYWDALRLKDQEFPLFDLPVEATAPDAPKREPPALEAAVTLPAMSIGQEVMTDYATAGLSLKRHPVALVRGELRKRNIITAAELGQLSGSRWVKVAGLVLIRQRPGTASGIVFETLEDETGVINLIVKPEIYDLFRPAARHASLLQCDGYVQREGQVIHVMAKRLTDLSELISGYGVRSRDFH